MKLSDEIMAALHSGELVIVPRYPIGAMQAAAHYAGRLWDTGRAERVGFVEEWSVAIEQWIAAGKPTGLLDLVRPVAWQDDPTFLALREALYPAEDSAAESRVIPP